MSRKIIRTLAVAAIVVLASATAASAHGTTLQQVRHATAPFQQLNTAKAAGYGLLTDAAGIHCISDMDMGAMGVHFVNGTLVGDDTVNALHPEALVYQPVPGHPLRLVAVEYVVFKAAWAASHTGRPHLFGQAFMLNPAGNRFGLPAFYSLHAWIWKNNPAGMFAPFNPNVTCPNQ
jgi:hypothetical protein